MKRAITTSLGGLRVGLFAVFICGCGYSFSGSSLPSYIKTIAIPVLENQSLDYQVADEVTQALVDRFISDNRLKVAPISQADAVLQGVLNAYENKVYGYSRDEAPEQYIVIMKISLALTDRVKNREIWAEENLVASGVYSPGGLIPGGPTSEEEARQKALEDLANDVLSRTLEQW
ncbi:MAG: hypothetical protein KJ970_12230 [Candidatus Eisenbacteria bacterium]|uniref:Lipopolysaccharide-assembly n=1 Tax=Eiseniibacteriota bacterium TaxID=2212470 RepID=A0A948RVB2_UNCEI|nr:hypothetical protein [Candidatus Eisenbacteria bacterium]MBU1947495.1 hypothetical protein [Candidatus Eisenbacteria bacterium]MBU2691685.1 hypothetical protein [Candidatus Eisenbacteria bacterium]